MLKEIFRTVPVPYFKVGEVEKYGQRYLLGQHYEPNIPPWTESLVSVEGLHVGRNPDKHATLGSQSAIYLWTMLSVDWWPGWGFGFYKFDAGNGKFVKRMYTPSSLGRILLLKNVHTSRAGIPYSTHLYGTILYQLSLGKTAETIYGTGDKTEFGEDEEDLKEGDTWSVVDIGTTEANVLAPASGFPIERFAPYDEDGNTMIAYGACVIDDSAEDAFLNANSDTLFVYTWTTGAFRYLVRTPDNVVAICLEDASRAYVLLGNRVILLFDYIRGEVLGATKVPALTEHVNFWNITDIRVAWDATYRRLLLVEHTPNNPDGTSSTVIRGFRLVPEPVRITSPIPLKWPRQGRMIPVMSQVVGDMNEGVGGYVLKAAVSGSGSLVGVPITDAYGRGFMQVACEGSPLYVSSPDPSFDWAGTGSPGAGSPVAGSSPHTGLVEIFVSAIKYQPPLADIQVSGTAGPQPGGAPGAPGGGSDSGSGLPETAPNMMYIMEKALATKAVWNFNKGDIYDGTADDGRGAFNRLAIQMMHDVDARFGYIKKTAGNRYKLSDPVGHANDALAFLNDDGVTGEIYDTLLGEGAVAKDRLTWGFKGRSEGERDRWMYPIG